MHKKMLMNTTLAVFLLLAVSSAVKGQYIIDAPYGSAPTIDGIKENGEWDDASWIGFTADVYVKQNGKSLYIALSAGEDNTFSNEDELALFIDVNHDGGASPQTDDIFFTVYRNGTPFEQHGEEPPSSPTGGWSVAVYTHEEGWEAEYNITFPKIEITPAEEKTLGILFTHTDTISVTPVSFWPPLTPEEAESPSNWGDLTSGDNWISEFSSAIILPLFMILSLTVVFVKLGVRARRNGNVDSKPETA